MQIPPILPETVHCGFVTCMREAQNVSNKKKEKDDALTASTLYFILVTFLTFDHLLYFACLKVNLLLFSGQNQRVYFGDERLRKHFK